MRLAAEFERALPTVPDDEDGEGDDKTFALDDVAEAEDGSKFADAEVDAGDNDSADSPEADVDDVATDFGDVGDDNESSEGTCPVAVRVLLANFPPLFCACFCHCSFFSRRLTTSLETRFNSSSSLRI
jgi:hypothetical protein